jgi:DNA-directed RNA polymerase subunit K/omega
MSDDDELSEFDGNEDSDDYSESESDEEDELDTRLDFETIKGVSKVPLRIEMIQVPDHKRETRPVLTIYELAYAVGAMATHIEDTGMSLLPEATKLPPLESALKHITEKKAWVKVKRVIDESAEGKQIVEIWDINDMSLPQELFASLDRF